ncbi:MAG TPA: sugar phosphate isomerase/epimerase [Lachnospiraceae bacterium]|nr:sugar phosphate isomerase/epimerase [Lachnospiraceae bacterium]
MLRKAPDPNRPLRLVMHTYSLHFWGFGSSWGIKDFIFPKMFTLVELMDKAAEWELDGLHVTRADLESIDPENLAYLKGEADKRGLSLEFNASFDDVDPRCNVTIQEAIDIARALESPIVKWGLDIKRPRKLYGSRFCPEVMTQLIHRYEQFKECLPQLEKYGIKFALENHTDTFSEEVIWLIEKLDSDYIGACVDTMNPLYVMEEPEPCIKRMLPYAIHTHFSDDLITCDLMGVHSVGGAIGQGSMDCERMIRQYRELSNIDTITFENECCMVSPDEPLEEAREREMKAAVDSIRYLREVCKVGLRNR